MPGGKTALRGSDLPGAGADAATRPAVTALARLRTRQSLKQAYRPAERTASDRDAIEHASFWLLVAGLAWVPFWYGSNVLLAWGCNAVLFAGLLAWYELTVLVRGRRHAVGLRHLALPAGLFAAVVLWIFLQTATWVPAGLAHPIWQMAADALGRPVRGSISVNRDLTNLALLRLLTAASVFWLAVQLCRRADFANRLIGAIAVIGAVYAAYGIAVLRTGQLSWLAIPSNGGMVSSTFYNRDSYASYAGLGLIATAGLIVRLYRDEPDRSIGNWRFRLGSFIATTGERGAAALAGGFLILAALLLTGSRGGAISAAIGLLAFGALDWRRRRHATDRASPVIPLALGGMLVAAVLLFGDIVGGSIEHRGVTDPHRVEVYLITLRSILDRPLLGFGYGTFGDVFAMYRDRSIDIMSTWGQAHDTYLEVLQGLGLVGGSLLIGTVALLVARCAGGALRRRQDAMVPQVAVGAACLVGFHALVDFALQMQAVALTFVALLGAGVAQSESTRRLLAD